MFDDRSGQRANGLTRRLWQCLVGLGLAALLGACANVDQQPAQPQPDESAAASPASDAAAAAAAAAAAKASASQQQAAPVTRVVTKTTWVRVRRGDSLLGIAASHKVAVKDLAAWNGIKPNSHVRIGQSLKLVSKQTITVQAAAPGPSGGASTGSSATAASTASSSASAEDSRQVAAEVKRHARSVALVWPARGKVVEPFEPGTTRGIEIAGKAGDPVIAAADGKVMYAGTGLNEYGSLIIVQHNKDFLTAYSHNRRLLVRTGDVVHQGQQIAEMGSEKNDRVAVMFEVRRDGKPVDPMPYLPSPQS
ncbi:peptidoglycan DD-metalloendopeptidase family protein [Paraburkholderia sacchari]|uniref:Peptidoglycan DD-metalloendopeptidase family protein n=1 Tax=Paraburkholderia sacchari TaxID=159450 RepID=A0A8T6ZP07_9BURK|nr:peptidoglycan DD-metalloendopeptidase family protein [Paraburkholderia sacchari]NLP65750.1 peptidoglycan DD-metalloendopeptidase family protein [Paraburkholderia sacchari]